VDRRRPWIYGGVRIGEGQAVTCCAPSRNSANWQEFLARLEQANPTGAIAVITDNLSSHHSLATRAWLAGHPRIEQVFIPKGACWLNLQEAWWRIFRRHALAGQTFADPGEIAQVTEVATAQLNARQALGLGTASATATTLPAPLYLPALRNAALDD
jgi:transposase